LIIRWSLLEDLVDAQLAPALAPWIAERFGIEARAVRDLSLRHAKDHEIYRAAREADAIVMTKDADFVGLLERLGPPPRVAWVTCGNTSNEHLRGVLQDALPAALTLLEQGEALVEISDAR
jgi:predicted nuclease of predicted toxin-antitoxin system